MISSPAPAPGPAPATAVRVHAELTPRMVDALYIEALLLADEAHAYFEGPGRIDGEALSPADRISLSCEALGVTTRLMHVISWLLTRRAVESGEISEEAGAAPARRMSPVVEVDGARPAMLPDGARQLIAAARDLHARIRHLDAGLDRRAQHESPARGLIARLECVF